MYLIILFIIQDSPPKVYDQDGDLKLLFIIIFKNVLLSFI